MKDWYKISKEDLISSLETDPQSGLTDDEVKKRISKYGTNELKEEEKKSFLSKLLAQFSDFLILILIGAALISFFVGEGQDAVVILAIVILNAL